MPDVFLVIGGSGFLGRHIVTQLVARGDTVSCFDIVQRYHDVPFYSGDITNEDSVSDALRKSGATCIIHTASPPHGKDPAIYYKVNVDGTGAIIAAAQQCGVRKLVFTSSAGVVFNGSDVIGVDERIPTCTVHMDAYNDSKAKAEDLVIAANGQKGLYTVALRPAGIFGPGDQQVMHGFYQVYENNQTHFQIGDNTNLFDWTYVGNVAKAHLLAADKLVPTEIDKITQEKYTLSQKDLDVIGAPLPPINLTTGSVRTPTSTARPLGPYITPIPNADKIRADFESPVEKVESKGPVKRSRFDQFSDFSLLKADKSPLRVDGEIFFITNGEPIYFWDFGRMIWKELDKHHPPRPAKRRIVFNKSIGLGLASLVEWGCWLVGKEATLTRFRVTYSCATRWHNIEKARRVLGYEPDVGLQEGINLMLDWWQKERESKKQ